MVYEGLCGEISIFFESQTDRLTDRQNRLLNPASRMRARGNEHPPAGYYLVQNRIITSRWPDAVSSFQGG